MTNWVDEYGKLEKAYLAQTAERDALKLQKDEAMKALDRSIVFNGQLIEEKKAMERLNSELAEALKDILDDHDERRETYPGAPEENPGRVAVMSRGRAILNKTEKRNDEHVHEWINRPTGGSGPMRWCRTCNVGG